MLFDKRVAYKPFEYPEFKEDWLNHTQAHWVHTELDMSKDVLDWKFELNDAERNLVGNILLGFAQAETIIEDYWGDNVTKWFPKHEIINFARDAASRETTHAEAYSYLNEILGLENFDAFLYEPTVKNKFDYLINTKKQYTYKTLKEDANARQDVARSLAIFSAFAEGVLLFSAFAVMYSFQKRNLLKGTGQQMKYSAKDEECHSLAGIRLFNILCDEYPEIREQVKTPIYQAVDLLLDMESKYLDMIFEQGDLPNISKAPLFEFVKKRTNDRLLKLGYTEQIEYDNVLASELDWFPQMVFGTEHHDFFAIRGTSYSKDDGNWSFLS